MREKYSIELIAILGLFEIIFVSTLYDNLVIEFLAIGVVSLLILWAVNFEAKYLKLFCIVAIAGFFSEFLPVFYGVWIYTTPNILGMPLWLPLLWGSAGVAIANFYEKAKL